VPHWVNPDAYQLYLRGLYELNRIWYKGGSEHLMAATSLFQQAVDKDAAYAPAYSGLAEAYMWSVFKGISTGHASETEANARTAAQKALDLDGSLADAHIAMALYFESQWDFAAMDEEAKRATQLDPNYARAPEVYGVLLIHMDRLKEASTQMQLAATLDPRSLRFLNFTGHYYDAAGQWDKLIETCQAEIKLDPEFLFPYAFLQGAYEQKGMFIEATQAYLLGAQRAGEDMKEANKVARRLRHAYETGGAQGYWKQSLQLALEDVTQGESAPVGIASLYIKIGEIDQAFVWFERAYSRHDLGMVTLKQFHALRSDPRYQDLLRRVGLPH
jgi:Tfp pilus assembly protein PilF